MNRLATGVLCNPIGQLPRRPSGRALCTVLAATLLATAITACGSSGSSTTSAAAPTGTYATNITDEPRRDGIWEITFLKDGSFTVKKRGEGSLSIGRGSHLRGLTLTINPEFANSCGPPPGTGTYALHLSGKELKLVLQKDPCVIRTDIFKHTFTKVG